MNPVCDIAIVGGGLAGASLALALAPLGFNIKVIEAVAFRAAEQPSYDDRTLVLSHSSCRILNGVDLWGSLKADATAIRKIFITEHKRPGQLVLDPMELGLSEFGHVVEARRFGRAVTRHLEQRENIEVVCPTRVSAVEPGQDNTVLRLESDTGSRNLAARLVVAADGAGSQIREYLKIGTVTRDYNQTAVICNVTPSLSHQGHAFECLTASGPFAVLPHTGTRCGLVWTVATADAAALLELEDAAFLARAQQRFGTALGSFLEVGKRSSYALKLVRAKKDICDRLLILGNAAHAIHPVGAQGFNLALRDVAVLAEILADDGLDDPGDSRLLQQYSRWRRLDQNGTIAWSDGLTRLFAHPSMLARGLCTAGFMAHSLFPGLRRQVANKAMGYRGRIPRLALGEPLIF